MTGQRITALYYKLELRPGLSYLPGARRTVVLDGFTGELADDRCKFIPVANFGSEADARAQLEPQLRAWRQWVVLTFSDDRLPFQFDSVDSEPWPPPKDGAAVLIVATSHIRISGEVVMLHQTLGEFPDPPPPFVVDDCTEIGLTLLEDARRLPRHLLKFAFAFLSLLESEHGASGEHRRGSVASALNVADDLLRDLGTICADGGQGAEARVFKHGKGRGGKRIELTPQRAEWVAAVFSELVRRQGQFAADAVPAEMYRRPLPLA
jgi:hypothetical protein